MKKRICFIVQRYGLEVNGGAELLCRQFAEHLVEFYEVDVLTTKAIQYTTWMNEYTENETNINGVHVKRFEVAQIRDTKKFTKINLKFLAGLLDSTEEEKWVEEQGPLVPELVKYVEEHFLDYEVFLFVTYLYYPTVFGVKVANDKAIVIPAAHDEPYINMKIYEDVFLLPKAIFYNTLEEKLFVERKFHNENILNDVGGTGIDIIENILPEKFKIKYNLHKYIIYVGRIDRGKKCDILLNYFMEYKKRNHTDDIQLVLIGSQVMQIQEHRDIICLGYVSDEDKFNGIAGAEVLVMPSEFESLSIVVLEAFRLKVPVLVNGKCEVLKGHCIRSNAGLYYTSYLEFEACLRYFLKEKDIIHTMGENGYNYVKKNYQWSVIINKLKTLIDKVVEKNTRLI